MQLGNLQTGKGELSQSQLEQKHQQNQLTKTVIYHFRSVYAALSWVVCLGITIGEDITLSYTSAGVHGWDSSEQVRFI